MRQSQRNNLIASGISTIDELAKASKNQIINKIDEKIIYELEEIWNFIDNETSFKPHIDVTDFPGFNYHKGLVFSAHSADLGFSIANGGNYFSQTASGSTRSAIGFDQDIIAMTKLKVKK